MSREKIQRIEQRIDRIKETLMEIGPLRPGSLTRQYKDPKHHTGAYWQISYTLRVPICEGFRLMPPSWFLRFWTDQACLG